MCVTLNNNLLTAKKDILDYNNDYLEISSSSWSNVSSWDDAKMNSENDNSAGMSSFSILDSENRFMALCCWHDDDESINESNNDDDESAVEITEIEKHQEIDNVMSYEEQVEMERQDYEVHESFHNDDNLPAEEVYVDHEGTDGHEHVEDSLSEQMPTALRLVREYPELDVPRLYVSAAYLRAETEADINNDEAAEPEEQAHEPSSSSSGAVTVTDGVDEEGEIDEVTDNIYLTTEEWNALPPQQFSSLTHITAEEWHYREQILQDGMTVEEAHEQILN